MALRTMTLNLVINETEIVDDDEGIARTRLTHPKLDGELYFVHSLKGGNKAILESLDESPISAVFGLVSIVKEIFGENESKQPVTNDPADGLSASSTKEKP
jgi:hypothetical protein